MPPVGDEQLLAIRHARQGGRRERWVVGQEAHRRRRRLLLLLLEVLLAAEGLLPLQLLEVLLLVLAVLQRGRVGLPVCGREHASGQARPVRLRRGGSRPHVVLGLLVQLLLLLLELGDEQRHVQRGVRQLGRERWWHGRRRCRRQGRRLRALRVPGVAEHPIHRLCRLGGALQPAYATHTTPPPQPISRQRQVPMFVPEMQAVLCATGL